MTQYDYIRDRLAETVDNLAIELETHFGCNSGDIDPLQAFFLDDYLNRVAVILSDVIDNNK